MAARPKRKQTPPRDFRNKAVEDLPALLTPAETALYVGACIRTMRTYIAGHKIAVVRYSPRKQMIRREAIAAFLALGLPK